MTSKLDEAEDGLLSALQDSENLSGVTVRLGDPGPTIKRDHIWIAEPVNTTQRWETSGVGAQMKRETFDLRVTVHATRTDADFTTLRSRAQAYSEAIETAVRADPTLGGAVWDSRVIAAARASRQVNEGRGIKFVVTVECIAFLPGG